MTINLGLDNEALYKGCTIEDKGEGKRLVTPMSTAIPLIHQNVNGIVSEVPLHDRLEVTLTGPMAQWAYLTVGIAMSKAFQSVKYCDGKTTVVIT